MLHHDKVFCFRRRLSRLDVYRVDTYSRVQGQSKTEVTGSKVSQCSLV